MRTAQLHATPVAAECMSTHAAGMQHTGILCYYCRTLKGFCILIGAFMKRGVQLSLLQLSFVSLRCGAITAKAVRFRVNAPLELKFMSLIVTAC